MASSHASEKQSPTSLQKFWNVPAGHSTPPLKDICKLCYRIPPLQDFFRQKQKMVRCDLERALQANCPHSAAPLTPPFQSLGDIEA